MTWKDLAPVARAFLGSIQLLSNGIRVLYRCWSTHGRVLQAMETYARAQELGITSGPVLQHLEARMVDASREYAQSQRAGEAPAIPTNLLQISTSSSSRKPAARLFKNRLPPR